MSLSWQILGEPGRDNAALVSIDSGQSIKRILFDCGDCLGELDLKRIHEIDHLMFSHLHMDHIAGFDQFFRCNYHRTNRENHIWGPVGTSRIIQHRFQGFLWNLSRNMKGTWLVHEFDGITLTSFRYELAEGFSISHDAGEKKVGTSLLKDETFAIKAYVMKHKGPCLAYHLIENDKENININKLNKLGLTPGPWLGKLKSGTVKELDTNKRLYTAEELRKELIESKPGESLAYLTDFLLEEQSHKLLSKNLSGVDVLICEAQYNDQDTALAKSKHHMTTHLVGQLAKDAQAKKLVLFHLSDRYSRKEWNTMLAEVKKEFPNATFSDSWHLGPQQ